MKKLQTVTLGCSKNKVDTEHILSQVEDLYEIVPEGEDIPVDVILLNTCGFIGDAKEESIQAVLEAVERKKKGEAWAIGNGQMHQIHLQPKCGALNTMHDQICVLKAITKSED